MMQEARIQTSFILETKDLSVIYGDGNQGVKHVSIGFQERNVTAIIGPSGCGKSTLLRALNRMNELIPGTHTLGEVWYNDKNIYDTSIDPVLIRRHIGMVFQKPNPFPKSVYQNIAWAAKVHGYSGSMDELVESSLRKAVLWDEVKDKLKKSAFALSGGQQQRLCIARAIALQPDVILMDEPTSALDPIAASYIEDLISELRNDYTIIIVTHNMQQAGRISDNTAFMLMGDLIEVGLTKKLFIAPEDERTERYLTGRFG
ncbi:MAG: phosphate ABC transporter ATP-binding protein PstB [Rectinema sp.]